MTLRIESSRKSSKKLFKMDPPAEYIVEKEWEMSYDAIMLFLSQLSRYFHSVLAPEPIPDWDRSDHSRLLNLFLSF